MHFRAFAGVEESPLARSEGCVFFFNTYEMDPFIKANHLLTSSDMVPNRVRFSFFGDPFVYTRNSRDDFIVSVYFSRITKCKYSHTEQQHSDVQKYHLKCMLTSLNIGFAYLQIVMNR